MEQFYLPAHFAPRVCPLHLINPKHNVPLSDGTDLEPQECGEKLERLKEHMNTSKDIITLH